MGYTNINYFDRFICQRLYYDADLWKLDVNVNKTKVMVFSKKKTFFSADFFSLQFENLLLQRLFYLILFIVLNATFSNISVISWQ